MRRLRFTCVELPVNDDTRLPITHEAHWVSEGLIQIFASCPLNDLQPRCAAGVRV